MFPSSADKYDKFLCDVVNTKWRCMRGLAAMKMSLGQYVRLLLDYRDTWIYPTNEPWLAL